LRAFPSSVQHFAAEAESTRLKLIASRKAVEVAP
jgi:hypothetical protein